MDMNEFRIRQELLHKELQKRSEIEEKALKMIANGQHEAAQKLLNSLDDEYIKSLM